MSKFGLDPDANDEPVSAGKLADRLAAFPLTAPRQHVDVSAMDAAAAAHGFVSRETSTVSPVPATKRRRLGVPEPTRHLAIRLTMMQYERFVAYADRHQLTYQDALVKLLNASEDI